MCLAQALQLAANGLAGSLPASLGQLPFLEHLDVSYNALQGPGPRRPRGAGFGTLRSRPARRWTLLWELPDRSCAALRGRWSVSACSASFKGQGLLVGNLFVKIPRAPPTTTDSSV